MPYASVSEGCVQTQGGGRQQRWLGLASKLECYCCSSYYVAHTIEGDVLQNPVVIINNHLPLQCDAKQTTLGFCSFIILFIIVLRTLFSDQINNIIIYEEKFCNSCFFVNCERFEPRSHFKSWLSLIVRVNVVLSRTVVVDSD